MKCARSRNIVFLVLALLSVLPLTGCWDRVEVNDLALITAAGVDQSKDRVELSVQVFIPRMGGGGQQQTSGASGSPGGQTFVRSASGVTIADAMSILQEKLPRRIFWGHNEVFIVGENLAKNGIRDDADYMMRHPQIREAAFIFVSKGEAKNMLELLPPLERSSSEVLREFAKSGLVGKMTLKDLMQRLSGDERAVGLPWIERAPPEPGEKRNEAIPFITGTAVLKRDILVGHIDDKVSRGLLWLRNEIHTAVVTVTPQWADGHISLSLLRAHSELIPKIENGKWSITLKAETEDDIVQNDTSFNLMNPKFSKQLENDLGGDVKLRVEQALNRVQKQMNADIFGFANAFHRKYPKEWNKVKDRWDEVFPNIEVNVQVKARVRRPGASTIPVGLPKDEVIEK